MPCHAFPVSDIAQYFDRSRNNLSIVNLKSIKMKNHLMMYKLFIIIHVETCTYITHSVNALVCFQQLHFSEVVQDTSYLYKSRKNYRCLFGI